jgi:hypothetical protein
MIDGAPSLVNFPTQELLRRRWPMELLRASAAAMQPGSRELDPSRP